MNATLTRETSNRWSLRWTPRPDFVQVERATGADLDEAADHAQAILERAGLMVVEVVENPMGNATLVVEEVER